METKKEIFADGIGQIHFAGNMVRFDFVTLQPAENGEAPVAQSNVRVIMPPQGFLNALNWPKEIYNMMPFIASMVVLAFTSKKSKAPKAEGIPYYKGSR